MADQAPDYCAHLVSLFDQTHTVTPCDTCSQSCRLHSQLGGFVCSEPTGSVHVYASVTAPLVSVPMAVNDDLGADVVGLLLRQGLMLAALIEACMALTFTLGVGELQAKLDELVANGKLQVVLGFYSVVQ